jgi:plasmid stabilization system protein ParE
MAGTFKVNWTKEATDQVNHILKFLRENWGNNECEDFLDLLLHFEKTISLFPKSIKRSKKYKNCRLGFIHRHITAIYKVSGKSITILTVIDNRSKVEK